MGVAVKKGENIAVRPEAVIEARYSLTSKQNDILDMVFCEIKDDNKYQYVISVEKYKTLYDTDTSNLYRDLKKAVKSFEGKGFRILNKDTKEEIYYSWFSKIHYIPQKGEIKVNIDLDFKQLLCEVKKRVYYNIKYTLNFNSNYSKRMYFFIKSFEDTGWRTDLIEDLQRKLECPKSYNNFANFKKYVLDIAEREINGNTDVIFKYDIKKKGNKVIGITTYITSKYLNGKKPKEQLVIQQYSTEQMSQINIVRTFLHENVGDIDILSLINEAKGDIDLIKEKYTLMKRQLHVRDIIGWLIDAIRNKEKYQPTISYSKKDAFTDYSQRNYDFDDLEKKLLGWDETQDGIEQVAMDLNVTR